MTARKSAEHEHDQADGPTWWRWMDIAVIVAIVVIVAIGAEWLIGLLIRERLAKGADRMLARSRRAPAEGAQE